MEIDKSETHIRLQRNGIAGWYHKTTWERIGKENNKEGLTVVPMEPVEVTQLREKKAMAEPKYNPEGNAVVENKPMEGEIKQLKRSHKKKVNEDKK